MEWIVGLVFLILLFRYPGCMVALLAVAGLGGWLAWHLLVTVPQEREEREQRIAEERAAKVRVQVAYERKACPQKRWPIWVEILNGADRTAERIEWKVEATAPGRSTELVGWMEPWGSDSLLPPGAALGLCFELPAELKGRRDLANLRYRASGVRVWFR